MWEDLKEETQRGPEFAEFPYFMAAVEFQGPAEGAISGLDDGAKIALIEAWKSKPRHPYEFTDSDRILKQYAVILIDLLVSRAKCSGARQGEF